MRLPNKSEPLPGSLHVTNCGTLKVLLHGAMSIRPLLQSLPNRRLSHQAPTKRPVWLSRMPTHATDINTFTALFLLLT